MPKTQVLAPRQAQLLVLSNVPRLGQGLSKDSQGRSINRSYMSGNAFSAAGNLCASPAPKLDLWTPLTNDLQTVQTTALH